MFTAFFWIGRAFTARFWLTASPAAPTFNAHWVSDTATRVQPLLPTVRR